jgi:hypothetical protein
VPTKIVNAGRFRKILYTVPRRGRVQVQLEASGPVSVYGVRAEDIETFKRGADFDGFSYLNRKVLDKEIPLPFEPGDDWYLVIENDSGGPVAVHYEVYDV